MTTQVKDNLLNMKPHKRKQSIKLKKKMGEQSPLYNYTVPKFKQISLKTFYIFVSNLTFVILFLLLHNNRIQQKKNLRHILKNNKKTICYNVKICFLVEYNSLK